MKRTNFLVCILLCAICNVNAQLVTLPDFLKKITEDKYLVSYAKPTETIDYGISLLEYRCANVNINMTSFKYFNVPDLWYMFGYPEINNIKETRYWLNFDEYPKSLNDPTLYRNFFIRNVQKGVINFISSDSIRYNKSQYYNGDTIRIPKQDTLMVTDDSRMSLNNNVYAFHNFFVRNENSTSINKDYLLKKIVIPEIVVKSNERDVSKYLYYFPYSIEVLKAQPNPVRQVLTNFKMFYGDTTCSFRTYQASCTNIGSTPDIRSVSIVRSSLDSMTLKITDDNSNLKKLKLVYSYYKANTPIEKRKYVTYDSSVIFSNNYVKFTNKSANISGISAIGDSVHYQLIAEFDTTIKPLIFKVDNATFWASAIRKINNNNVKSEEPSSQKIYFNNSFTFCGNYKIKANIVGDSVNCLNETKSYTSSITNLNDKSLAFVWKYTTSASTSPTFNVKFTSAGINNIELTLTSVCGIGKITKTIQTHGLGRSISSPINFPVSGGQTYSNTQNNTFCSTNSGGQISPDIYYSFVLRYPRIVKASTCGSGLKDTYISLLNSDGNVNVFNDDNGPICSGLSASISKLLSAGTYYLRVEGYNNLTGSITTSLYTCVPPLGINISSPINIGDVGSNFCYSDSKNNSDCFDNSAGQLSPDINYKFVLTTPTTITASTCGSGLNDTYLSLLNSDGSVNAYNDDNGPVCAGLFASISKSLSVGTYYFRVEGYSSYTGNISLNFKTTGCTQFREEKLNENLTNNEDTKYRDVSVYPNPSSGSVFLRIPELNEVSLIKISDSAGKLLYTFKPDNIETEINTSQFPSGVYYLIVQLNNKLVTKKLQMIK